MISGYRLMWLLVMFDLPTTTKEHRRQYKKFVDKLSDDGYTRIQFSVYARPCATDENTAVHHRRIVDWLPPEGEVRVMQMTDKQWGRICVYREGMEGRPEVAPEQFLFFDLDLDPMVEETHALDLFRKFEDRPATPSSKRRKSRGVAGVKVAEKPRKYEAEQTKFDFFD